MNIREAAIIDHDIIVLYDRSTNGRRVSTAQHDELFHVEVLQDTSARDFLQYVESRTIINCIIILLLTTQV